MDGTLQQQLASRVAEAGQRFERARFYVDMVRDPLGTVAGRFRSYGDSYLSPTSPTPLLVTKDPDAIRDILITKAADFGKGHRSFDLLRTVLGDSLLTSEGETWRRQRRLVQPAFSKARLEGYARVMAEEANATLRRLATSRTKRVDMAEVMTGLTLRIVARTLFGYDVDESPRVGRAMRWLNQRFASVDVLPKSLPTPARLKMKLAKRDLDQVVAMVIAERRKTLRAGQPVTDDLLQQLLDVRDETGQGLSDLEIRDQLLTLYLAGHDTTANGLSWTLYLLSQHPRALLRMQEEVDSVLRGRPPRHGDLASLPFTEAAFKEAMRLYPPVLAIPRKVVATTSAGGKALAPGSEAIVWVYHAHRDGRLFEQPTEYLPQRFLADGVRHPKHAYLPFGLGQRACIGQQFAMIEAQLILATLVQGLDFGYCGAAPPGLRLGVTLAPQGGVPMRVRARDVEAASSSGSSAP